MEVAPHAGAWIETLWANARAINGSVAPHAGAWIETHKLQSKWAIFYVAPHAGAWIETLNADLTSLSSMSRAPCGRVD